MAEFLSQGRMVNGVNSAFPLQMGRVHRWLLLGKVEWTAGRAFRNQCTNRLSVERRWPATRNVVLPEFRVYCTRFC